MSTGFVVLLALLGAPATPAPDRAEAYYHFSLGLQARFGGDVPTALDEYRRALKLDPRSADIRVELAKLLRDTGRAAEALGEAKEAVALDAEHVDARLVLAHLYQMQGDEPSMRQAAAEYEQVVRLKPSDPGALLTLAMIYGQLDDHAAAIRTWETYAQLDPGNFEAQLQIGSHSLAQGNSEKAAQAFQRALELEPDSARAFESLARAYAAAQQTDQAILHYRKALELEPQNLKYRLALGDVAFKARRFQEALAEADTVLATDGRNRFALDLRARSLRELKQFDAADEAVGRLLGLEPGDLKAAYLKVTIAEARRDFTAAAGQLEEIVDRAERDTSEEGASNLRVFLVHLGYAYQQLNRPGDAADAFGRAKAVGGEPDEPLLTYYVEALFAAKRFDQALSEARAARTRFPASSELAIQEANVLREKGDVGAALHIVEELRARAPKDLEVLLNVAEFHQRAKRFAEAEAELRAARELAPRDLRVLFQLGAALERQERHDDAEAVFKEALGVEPDSGPVLNYLGYMNADRGVRVEEALARIERALAQDPENGAYLDSRGWALYRLNRLEEAEDSLRRALDKNPTNAVILAHMGDTLERRGQLQGALEYWRKALAGEDEGEELDRARVEGKIQHAVASLEAKGERP